MISEQARHLSNVYSQHTQPNTIPNNHPNAYSPMQGINTSAQSSFMKNPKQSDIRQEDQIDPMILMSQDS
jgi:hypothetical protein